MALSYPLSEPTSIGIAQIDFTARNAISLAASPFSFKQQVFQHSGQSWGLSVSIPPCKKDLAEPWVSFLVGLKGQFGTFLMGDPNNTTPQGEAGGTPLVNGAGQSGDELIIDGATISQTGWLKAGDYIQLGSGSSATLHKVLQDVDTDSGGNATLDIWPSIRTAPADNATVTLTSCKGVFRLSTNNQNWSIDDISSYGISFQAVEAIT